MPRAERHQPFANIPAGGYAHAQPITRVLVHKAPIHAHQPATLSFRHAEHIAAKVMHGTRIRRHLPGEHTQQRCLAGTAFTDNRHNLSGSDIKRHTIQSGDGAELQIQPFGFKQ